MDTVALSNDAVERRRQGAAYSREMERLQVAPPSPAVVSYPRGSPELDGTRKAAG
jgi:hypothetical protein